MLFTFSAAGRGKEKVQTLKNMSFMFHFGPIHCDSTGLRGAQAAEAGRKGSARARSHL